MRLTTSGIVDRFEPADWVLVGYLLGLAVLWFAKELESTPTEPSTSWTEESRTLDEDHLRRLEDGEPVRLRRWHGNDLVLEGALVVGDVEEDVDDE
jgi:hypothetical protein